MTLRSRVAGLAALLLFLAAALGAGCSHGNRLTKVVRTNKTTVIGTLVAMRPDVVILKTPDGTTVEIPRTEISSIETPTLSEIAALQGAGSGSTAANGGGTNPSGGASNPSGGGPGAGQGGTGPGAGGTPGTGGAGDANGQRASSSGSPTGQPTGDPNGTASNRVPASTGGPGGSGAPGYGGSPSGTSANRNPAGGGTGASGGTPSGVPSNGSASGGSASTGAGTTGSGSAGSGAGGGPSGTGRPIVLPAYAEMVVTLDTDLGSETSHTEEEVSATLTQPMMVSGVERVPAGARLRGTIIEAVPGAQARGQGRLAFRFHTLIVGSSSIPIDTYLVRKIAGRLSKEDAKKIGVGAAIGGAMGKILTKTKQGLGIGAAAGAGGTAIALSRRPDIHLERGTALRIKLQKRVSWPTP